MLTGYADGARKEAEEVAQEPSDMFSVVAQFIERGGDAEATADRVAEWLATRADSWHNARTFAEDDHVTGARYLARRTVVHMLAAGQVAVREDNQSLLLVVPAASLRPILAVDLSVGGQASRVKLLHDDTRLDGMWDVFVVRCTSWNARASRWRTV